MRVSQLVTRLRDRIDESSANIYTDIELVRYLDEASYDLFRTQAQVDESWHNCEFDLTNTSDGSALHTRITLYDLPLWCHKVTGVRETSDSASSRFRDIPVRTMHNRFGEFWAYHGFNRIMVVGTASGKDITVECSKIPAPLNQGTIALPPALTNSTTVFHYDVASSTESVYEHPLEDDWYLNSIFEFTGVDSGSHTVMGEIRRGLSSSLVFDPSDQLVLVTLDAALTDAPTTADTWEMHAEVQTANIGLLIDLATHKALIKKSNWEAVNALTPDLDRERLKFIESITPRQDQMLPFQGMEDDYLFTQDPDRDWAWGGR